MRAFQSYFLGPRSVYTTWRGLIDPSARAMTADMREEKYFLFIFICLPPLFFQPHTATRGFFYPTDRSRENSFVIQYVCRQKFDRSKQSVTCVKISDSKIDLNAERKKHGKRGRVWNWFFSPKARNAVVIHDYRARIVIGGWSGPLEHREKSRGFENYMTNSSRVWNKKYLNKKTLKSSPKPSRSFYILKISYCSHDYEHGFMPFQRGIQYWLP